MVEFGKDSHPARHSSWASTRRTQLLTTRFCGSSHQSTRVNFKAHAATERENEPKRYASMWRPSQVRTGNGSGITAKQERRWARAADRADDKQPHTMLCWRVSSLEGDFCTSKIVSFSCRWSREERPGSAERRGSEKERIGIIAHQEYSHKHHKEGDRQHRRGIPQAAVSDERASSL